MCTVTYIPKGKDQFILTSNRDEAPGRSASGLVQENQAGKELLFPRDPIARGTWIATSNADQLICVLNGAFQKHHHRPPYRLSRGIMALQFFSFPDALAFFRDFDFVGMEPFTMVVYDRGKLYDLRWDEKEVHVEELSVEEKHIWSSCTLYSEVWQAKRRQWFADWQKEEIDPDREAILGFHKHGGEGNPEYDVVMNRFNIVRTTSITSVQKGLSEIDVRYEDILTGEVLGEILALK